MNVNTKNYYSVIEMAQELSVHPNTVINAIKSGRLAAFKIGLGKNSAFRIPISELYRICEMDSLKRINENKDKNKEIA